MPEPPWRSLGFKDIQLCLEKKTKKEKKNVVIHMCYPISVLDVTNTSRRTQMMSVRLWHYFLLHILTWLVYQTG